MSKISDELRAAANMLFLSGSNGYNVLMDLADRIDRELVELPKDADGVPIHLGDTVYAHGFPDGNGGATCKVCSIELNEGRESKIKLDDGGAVTYRTPSSLTHELPDSFERIADELEAWCDGADVDGDACDKPRNLAERIRKLAKEGEQ